MGFSPDAKAQRLSELRLALHQIAPELISDNRIDLARLKDLLGDESFAANEHYELSWAGKTAARREIQKTTSNTLQPFADNPTHAPHMLIEGENLEVLRVLQKSYYGKVKMIYIDPPYNTGNDSFVYPDDYSETLDEYQKRTGEKNQDGFLNKQSLWKKNSKESGQYHSAWLSMMYPRLYLARNLLRDDGVIFISIDDNEAANLKLLCDEVFGAENFVAQFPWRKRTAKSDVPFGVSQDFEWVVCYAKSNNFVACIEGSERKYYETDDLKGRPWRIHDMSTQRTASERPNSDFTIINPKSNKEYPVNPNAVWRVTKETFKQFYEEDRIVFPEDYDFLKITNPVLRYFKEDDIKKSGDMFGYSPVSTNFPAKIGMSQDGTKNFSSLFENKIFDYPKPVNLIKHLIQSASNIDKSAIILDFFAGSGTTAQAVMELNLEDGGNRQCICVQMPEVLDETSEAYKAGYRTIADITRARIDKVIDKLKAEHPDKTADLACANFTLAPSNFKVWRSDVADVDALRAQLEIFQAAEKVDSGLLRDESARNDGALGNSDGGENDGSLLDSQTAMLSELLLKFGLGALGVHAITSPLSVAGVTVHRVLMNDDAVLWLCFEPYSASLKDAIVTAKPAQVIMLNSCFVGDKKDELLSNLQLELAGLDIGLTVI